MARPNLLVPHLPEITAYFEQLDYRAFTYHRLNSLLDREKYFWEIPLTRATKDIVKFLLRQGLLQKTEFGQEPGTVAIFSWKTTDIYTVITGLRADSFFAYYTALSLHGLTQQLPKTYYLNTEHGSPQYGDTREDLTQAAVDKAFAGEQRRSEREYTQGERRVVLTNSKYTGKTGLTLLADTTRHFYYTDLERTLIDIAVRPAYSGGVTEILEAYRAARGRLDVSRLAAYLKEMDFIYPYEQAIGFYLERAGYGEEELKKIVCDPTLNFYLSYGIRNREFSDRWRIWYPKGI